MARPALRFRSAYTYLFAIALFGILWTANIFITRPLGYPFAKSPGPSIPPGPSIGLGNSGAARPDFHYIHPVIDVTIPSKVKVIGLVFYGRRELVEILDCYLKRNLKDNGGILDHVIFTVNTDNEDDLAYLEGLVATSPRYSKHIKSTGEYQGWTVNWESATDPDAIYIKIDDDVVFIEDAAIPSVVKRLLENPRYFAASANTINNPMLSWVHYSMGAHEPYFPASKSTAPPPPAPFEGHRWLPVRVPHDAEKYDLTKTPVSTLTIDPFGPSCGNWAAGAQSHYSFLQHLEIGDTWRYKFDTWDYAYQRLSINFLALRGKDIIDAFPFPHSDDEGYLTTIRPKELKRHVVVDGAGLAVHMSFGAQYHVHEYRGLMWTDLLGRYRMYAEEMICLKPGNQTGEGANHHEG